MFNLQKQSSITVDGAVAPAPAPSKREPAKAAAQRKVPAKPKTQEVEVIVISPDTEEAKAVRKEEPEKNKKKAQEKSSKKNARALTAVLTARSKAACGISKKPKEQITDIDAGDANNELAVVEYIEDLYKFYKLVEVCF